MLRMGTGYRLWPTSASLSRYSSTMRWLLKDSAWRYRKSVILILGAGSLSIAVQVAALGQVVLYASSLEGERQVRILGMEFAPRSSLELLVLLGFGVLILLSIAALLQYYSRSETLAVARHYQDLCSKRIVGLLGEGFDAWRPRQAEPYPMSFTLNLV